MEPEECPLPSAEPLEDDLKWWAMSAVFNRSLLAASSLDALGVEHFVPKRYVVRTVGGKKQRDLVPAVCNLLFIRTTVSGIRGLKAQFPYLQYLIRREAGRGYPIVVPTDQMRDFIRVAETYDDGNLYFTPEELDLCRGRRVRIHGGVLDGVEGILLKVKGARDRRVVISLDNVMSVAAATIHPDLIEILEE